MVPGSWKTGSFSEGNCSIGRHGGWKKKWGEGRREKEKPTWIQIPSSRGCEAQAALPKVSYTGQFFPQFCGFHTNFNLLKLTRTTEGGVINNGVAIKELPVTSFLLSIRHIAGGCSIYGAGILMPVLE